MLGNNSAIEYQVNARGKITENHVPKRDEYWVLESKGFEKPLECIRQGDSTQKPEAHYHCCENLRPLLIGLLRLYWLPPRIEAFKFAVLNFAHVSRQCSS